MMTMKVPFPFLHSPLFHHILTLTAEICEDVMEECQKYGTILSMKIPRPSMGSRQSAGVGKIFIKYENAESAKKALQALAGRKFADRTVVTTYFDEVCFPISKWWEFGDEC